MPSSLGNSTAEMVPLFVLSAISLCFPGFFPQPHDKSSVVEGAAGLLAAVLVFRIWEHHIGLGVIVMHHIAMDHVSIYAIHCICDRWGSFTNFLILKTLITLIFIPCRPSCLSARNPPGWRSSPTILLGSDTSLSTTVTLRPSRASVAAIAEPRIPAPTTTTSVSSSKPSGAEEMFWYS